MKHPLRILLVEDSPDDTELVLHALRDGGREIESLRVDSAARFGEALASRPWDVILSDDSLPSFSGAAALAQVQASGLDIPFILISGTIGEEVAVKALKAGAHDFIVKGQFARLVPAIERELREAEDRAARRRAQAEAESATRERIRAETASAEKSRLLASVNHELRTPLTSILGYAELLRAGRMGPLSGEQERCVDAVLASGRHLLNLTNEILDLSKIEAGRMTLERAPTHLGPLVREVHEMLAPLALERGIVLVSAAGEELPLVFVDAVRIKQVLINLLSNAVKFTPRGGDVELAARQRTGAIEISVRDTGVGLRAGDLPRLFREFERIESAQGERVAGTGLGLALSRLFVELHGGTIGVVSELGRGTTFTVTLPLRALGVENDATHAQA